VSAEGEVALIVRSRKPGRVVCGLGQPPRGDQSARRSWASPAAWRIREAPARDGRRARADGDPSGRHLDRQEDCPRSRGLDDSRACRARDPRHALLPGEPTPVNVCRVAWWRWRVTRRARLLAQGRAEMIVNRQRAGAPEPQDGPRVPPRRWTCRCVGGGQDIERYGANPGATGRRRRLPRAARSRRTGHHAAAAGGGGRRRAAGQGGQRAVRARLLQVILCYKCVEACGDVPTPTRSRWRAAASAPASHGYAAPLGDSACVYCGNCIGVCPTGALMFKRARHATGRHVGRGDTVDHGDDLPLLWRGLHARATRAGQHDRQGHLASGSRRDARSPLHQGRFGWQFVQNRP
jgi:NAD-dependent dihydropyrimidine dehydrogenase PreA subunit